MVDMVLNDIIAVLNNERPQRSCESLKSGEGDKDMQELVRSVIGNCRVCGASQTTSELINRYPPHLADCTSIYGTGAFLYLVCWVVIPEH